MYCKGEVKMSKQCMYILNYTDVVTGKNQNIQQCPNERVNEAACEKHKDLVTFTDHTIATMRGLNDVDDGPLHTE